MPVLQQKRQTGLQFHTWWTEQTGSLLEVIMKYESQYYEPLVVDEVWGRQGDELIRLEPDDGNGDSGKEDAYEHYTQGQ